MSWITEVQANAFLDPNPTWDTFENKDELLRLATNRLEQLTFKDEPVDRVEERYLDGNSLSKVAGTADFLLDAKAGNFAFHEALGWTRSSALMDIIIYDLAVAVVFDVPDIDAGLYSFQNNLTLSQIQSLHSFGGTFGGSIALDIDDGTAGVFTSIETQQANAIVDKFGEQVFAGPNRRINSAFTHNGVNVLLSTIEGTQGSILDGVATVDVTDEQGNPKTNIVPNILAGDIFTYSVKVIDGLDNTMFLYVNDILISNPTFGGNTGGKAGNRLLYTSGSAGGVDRHTYVQLFGAVINTENPITIPIRLVGACALLAVEYGQFPPSFIGNEAYLENENDYNRMQDLPINVQAAVEPFLADYESVVNEDGIATTTARGEESEVFEVTEMTKLEHE
jgi:hypothetical protein